MWWHFFACQQLLTSREKSSLLMAAAPVVPAYLSRNLCIRVVFPSEFGQNDISSSANSYSFLCVLIWQIKYEIKCVVFVSKKTKI
jgi:hypothetical protein